MALPETATCPEHERTAYLKPWGKYSHKLGEGPDGEALYCNKTPAECGIGANGSVSPRPVTHQTREKIAEPDWDEIARGKTRCALAQATIQSGQLTLTPELKEQLGAWVDWIFGEPDF